MAKEFEVRFDGLLPGNAGAGLGRDHGHRATAGSGRSPYEPREGGAESGLTSAGGGE